MIEILLWQDIKTLGKRGDVVKVVDGYARNYLFPRKLATRVAPHYLKALETEKKRIIREEEKRKQALQAEARKIESLSCTIEVNANEEGVLFGSITSEMVAENLHHEGVKLVTPEMVKIESPIKELGVYRIKVKLHPEIETECRIWVVEATEPKKSRLSVHGVSARDESEPEEK